MARKNFRNKSDVGKTNYRQKTKIIAGIVNPLVAVECVIVAKKEEL